MESTPHSSTLVELSGIDHNSGYGLWLSSEPVDPADESGYADLTDWFCIVPDEDSTCSSIFSVSSTSSPSSAAATSASEATTPTQANNSSSTSETLASQMTGSDSDPFDIDRNGRGLSTGALAGIVLGALAGLAVILLITLWTLRRKHEERRSRDTATAELNALTDDDRRPELGVDEKLSRHELEAGSDMVPPIEKDGDALTSAEDSTSKTEKLRFQQDAVELP